MADEPQQDIFAKIDTMLGKRAGFGGDTPTLEEEFPLLTDMVAGASSVTPERSSQVADALSPQDKNMAPSRDDKTLSQLSDIDIDRLAAALEARLAERLIRQQLRIEALVRRLVREELDIHRN